MKEIRLASLSLRNFKGVQDFTLVANEKSVRISGDNATGKTTIFDGFLWLLFDKDSQNKKKFSIKTLKDGVAIKGLEHEVEAVFRVDGQTLSLKKIYNEKYKKTRNSAHKEFDGHETNHFIDGVPTKLKDYTAKIAELINEDAFKLLTSPSFFNEQLHWQERRKILLEVCGDVADQDVISTNKKLAPLPGMLAGRSIEDHRKVIAAKKAEINKEMDKLPARIDEVERSKPDVGGLSEKELGESLKKIEKKIEEKENEVARVRSGSAVIEKEKEQRGYEIELMNLANQYESANHKRISEKTAELYNIKNQANELETRKQRLENQRDLNVESIERNKSRMKRLREDWESINSNVFKHTEECACPTCGQDLPEEKVQAAIEKARADFNLKKSSTLEDIKHQGVQAKNEVHEWEKENAEYTEGVTTIQTELDAKLTELEVIQKDIEAIRSETKAITETDEYKEKTQIVANIALEIKKLKESVEESLQEKLDDLRDLKMQAAAVDSQRARFGQVKAAENRIAELLERERELSEQFSEIEKQLFLTEEFIRTKVEMLTEKINSQFEFARFKLFDTQVDGALNETCVTTFDGVPYDSGLNNAAKINVGLDIINTLSTHYQFRAPIFVDNAEAVTEMIDTKSQLVSLVVSEKDKTLRVETAKESITA